MKKVAILSIDGGGIRGILPGTILRFIEQRIQKETNNPDARLVDYFDFVAGTSTGGILGCGMLIPNPLRPGRPQYTMEEVVNLYLENGSNIFKKPIAHRFRTLFGIMEEKYPNATLLKTLHKYFNDFYLSDLLRPCLFTAYDIESRGANFFKFGKACDNESFDFLVRDVAQATAAAPTYFEPALIKSRKGVNYALVDGGVFANNPSMCAYAEVRKCDFDHIQKPTSKDMFMVSLGTGNVKEPIPFERAKRFGLIQWIKPLIDIMMSGNSETVSHQLQWLFDAGNNQEGYIRLEPELHKAKPDMDNASPSNMSALVEAGEVFIQKNEELIHNLVLKLIDNRKSE
ncbi:patatin-like phospholipase family protein [Mongoliitalea daihaiensis]|uniref:patatin-like phospholipase family protein n=1 Tax=Mongoliitalea daihaiensis TaxID=2782006 RepID=UPI001F1C98DC|nr:patatin-like phospholipase family protein [Mongoliitalea daihaiensis]UJP63898.1 patatin-like phospholipase family protein [Mongoliitalea daihaiensis]